MLTSTASFVFVHGLQGHPYGTWAAGKPSRPVVEERADTDRTRSGLRSWRRRRDQPKDGSSGADIRAGDVDSTRSRTFWPADLLPRECPEARILTWGYDSKIIQSLTRSTSKTGIFAHGKNLLWELTRSRELSRPIVFVAHSLGGIVVKEVSMPGTIPFEPTLNGGRLCAAHTWPKAIKGM